MYCGSHGSHLGSQIFNTPIISFLRDAAEDVVYQTNKESLQNPITKKSMESPNGRWLFKTQVPSSMIDENEEQNAP